MSNHMWWPCPDGPGDSTMFCDPLLYNVWRHIDITCSVFFRRHCLSSRMTCFLFLFCFKFFRTDWTSDTLSSIIIKWQWIHKNNICQRYHKREHLTILKSDKTKRDITFPSYVHVYFCRVISLSPCVHFWIWLTSKTLSSSCQGRSCSAESENKCTCKRRWCCLYNSITNFETFHSELFLNRKSYLIQYCTRYLMWWCWMHFKFISVKMYVQIRRCNP